MTDSKLKLALLTVVLVLPLSLQVEVAAESQQTQSLLKKLSESLLSKLPRQMGRQPAISQPEEMLLLQTLERSLDNDTVKARYIQDLGAVEFFAGKDNEMQVMGSVDLNSKLGPNANQFSVLDGKLIKASQLFKVAFNNIDNTESNETKRDLAELVFQLMNIQKSELIEYLDIYLLRIRKHLNAKKLMSYLLLKGEEKIIKAQEDLLLEDLLDENLIKSGQAQKIFAQITKPSNGAQAGLPLRENPYNQQLKKQKVKNVNRGCLFNEEADHVELIQTSQQVQEEMEHNSAINFQNLLKLLQKAQKKEEKLHQFHLMRKYNIEPKKCGMMKRKVSQWMGQKIHEGQLTQKQGELLRKYFNQHERVFNKMHHHRGPLAVLSKLIDVESKRFMEERQNAQKKVEQEPLH